jgi:hypothetical protein
VKVDRITLEAWVLAHGIVAGSAAGPIDRCHWPNRALGAVNRERLRKSTGADRTWPMPPRSTRCL